jgi:hypothetical protein
MAREIGPIDDQIRADLEAPLDPLLRLQIGMLQRTHHRHWSRLGRRSSAIEGQHAIRHQYDGLPAHRARDVLAA